MKFSFDGMNKIDEIEERKGKVESNPPPSISYPIPFILLILLILSNSLPVKRAHLTRFSSNKYASSSTALNSVGRAL